MGVINWLKEKSGKDIYWNGKEGLKFYICKRWETNRLHLYIRRLYEIFTKISR